MLDEFKDLLEGTLRIRENEGSDKVMSLREAIARYVSPGMMLNFNATHTRPKAAIYEIVRQFHGKDPQFTIVGTGFGSVSVILVHCGLVKKIISSYCGDGWPTPAPNPVFQRAYLDGSVEFENWSILTVPQRLMAAAMGLEFISTKSIIGSSMAEENKDSFKVIDDPFSGDKVALMKALHPDLTFMHGWVADRNGNTILTPPYSASVYGALASKNGTIVTVEKIVSTEFVRRHAHMAKIPAYAVKAVCVVPMGGHPSGINDPGIEGLEPYADDYDFQLDVRLASRDPKKLDAWVEEWVLSCRDQEDYIEKLGHERVYYLKGKAQSDSWRSELQSWSGQLATTAEYGPVEMMIVVASRKVREIIRRKDYHTILAGVGTSNLAAWMANYDLKDEGYDVDLMAEVGFYGYAPRPADPFIFNFRNMPTCKLLTDIVMTMSIFMGGQQNQCIGVIGAGQIDKVGNVNSTKIPGETYLVGSGGANDIASSARELVVTAIQSRNRFLDQVPYITSPGTRVSTLVSTLGVFEKLDGDTEFTLTGYFPNQGMSKDECVRNVVENCGWRLKVARDPVEVAPATLEELKMLRLFDPRRQFIGKDPRKYEE